jgi:hypothetical protein
MEGGKRINIYLDSASLETAVKLGDGNVSEGIRLALAALQPENAPRKAGQPK